LGKNVKIEGNLLFQPTDNQTYSIEDFSKIMLNRQKFGVKTGTTTFSSNNDASKTVTISIPANSIVTGITASASGGSLTNMPWRASLVYISAVTFNQTLNPMNQSVSPSSSSADLEVTVTRVVTSTYGLNVQVLVCYVELPS